MTSISTIRTNKLDRQDRANLERRMGISDTVLKLLGRAKGLDLLLAEEQVRRDVHIEDIGGGFTLKHETLANLYYPVAGYPPAYS
ncbi:hypothetical protein Kurepalu1_00018 [Pseudomonas phage vB_PpuP-Kurepalu-1]